MPIRDQDLWVAGSRLFVQRDPIDVVGNGVLVAQPWVDIGTVDTINPTLTPTISRLKDGVSGLRQLIDSRTVRQAETYVVVTRNLALRNWNLLQRGRRVESFSQALQQAASKVCTHRFFPGQIVKLQDENGRHVYNLQKVIGIHTPTGVTQGVVTAISNSGAVGTHTITVSGDLSGANPPLNSLVVLKPEGLAAGTAQQNAGTYEITAKSAFGGGVTTLTVREALATIESSLTGQIIYKSGAGGNISAGPNNTNPLAGNPGPAWNVLSLVDGTVYAIDGKAINAEADLVVIYSLAAIADGARVVIPQTLQGEIRGRMELFWNRGNYAEMSVRRGRIAITPGPVSIVDQGDQMSSITFNLEMLTDESAADPDGDLFYFRGALPALT